MYDFCKLLKDKNGEEGLAQLDVTNQMRVTTLEASELVSYMTLILSAPQDVTNVIKTRSRLRAWVGRVHN